jgi:Family of unknown function (DUF5706)
VTMRPQPVRYQRADGHQDTASHQDAAIWVAESLLTRNREDIGHADGKASILAGIGVGIATLVITSGTAGPVVSSTGRWFFGIGGVVWTVGVVMLALAVLPRLGTRGGAGRVSYFGDVRRLRGVDSLKQHVENAARDQLTWLLIQVYDTSVIVAAKYRCIQVGLVSFAVGGSLAALGLMS